MIIAKPEVRLIAHTQLAEGWRGKLGYEDPCTDMELVVERCGRVSWKSEAKIEQGSAAGFMTRVVNIRKDESIAEHASATLLFVTDRYVSHQLVRHRIAAYTQESTHYINYGKGGGNQIQVCEPLGLKPGSPEYVIWASAMSECEHAYFEILERGVKHYHARYALPSCLKTEIAATFNLRMWRHVFKERCTPNNTPEIVLVMKMALGIMAGLCPTMFEDQAKEFLK